MDSSFTVKPRPGAHKSYAPRDPVPVREAVETDLSAAKTVTATRDGAGKQGQHNKHGDHHPEHAPHDVVVDPTSLDMIYRERDVRTVGREHPDDALLRQRAYGRKAASGEAPPAPEPQADIEA